MNYVNCSFPEALKFCPLTRHHRHYYCCCYRRYDCYSSSCRTKMVGKDGITANIGRIKFSLETRTNMWKLCHKYSKIIAAFIECTRELNSSYRGNVFWRFFFCRSLVIDIIFRQLFAKILSDRDCKCRCSLGRYLQNFEISEIIDGNQIVD